MFLKKQTVLPFQASYYSAKLRKSIDTLAIANLTANELWGKEVPKEHFRNCLAGDEEHCAELWKDWSRVGIIENDKEESYFILRHSFFYKKKYHIRWAIFASIDIRNSEILEHEQVSKHAVKNTKNRIIASKSDLSPIYVGMDEKYSNEWSELMEKLSKNEELFLCYNEDNSSKHKIWKISNKEILKEIHSFISDKYLYLLDGHHRLIAVKENNENGIGDGEIFSCISTMNENELIILPTHRVIVESSWIEPKKSLEELKKRNCSIKKSMAWDPKKIDDLIEKLKVNEFYFLPAQRTMLYLIEVPLSERYLMIDIIEKKIFPAKDPLKLLPVEDFHTLMNDLASGKAQAAILLPKISSEDVRRRANEKRYLPRKSTKFFPKPGMGLLARNWKS